MLLHFMLHAFTTQSESDFCYRQSTILHYSYQLTPKIQMRLRLAVQQAMKPHMVTKAASCARPAAKVAMLFALSAVSTWSTVMLAIVLTTATLASCT